MGGITLLVTFNGNANAAQTRDDILKDLMLCLSCTDIS